MNNLGRFRPQITVMQQVYQVASDTRCWRFLACPTKMSMNVNNAPTVVSFREVFLLQCLRQAIILKHLECQQMEIRAYFRSGHL